MQIGALVNSTPDTLKKSMLRKRGQTEPGLVALYIIQLGNRAGLLLQPRSPHRASSGRVCVCGWIMLLVIVKLCWLSGETVMNEPLTSVDRLLFHPRCGLHAAVINSQCTAHRPQWVAHFCVILRGSICTTRLASLSCHI